MSKVSEAELVIVPYFGMNTLFISELFLEEKVFSYVHACVKITKEGNT